MNSSDAVDRFGILLRIIQAGGASSEIYTQAYESARRIQDKDEQLNSLLALLDEIDFDVNVESQPSVNQSTDPSATSSQDANVQQQQNSDQSF